MAKKKARNDNLPTEEEVTKFEMLEKLLDASYDEMKELSKKKQDEVLNKFKVKLLNRVLSPIKEIMRNEPIAEYLDLLDEDTLPSNSDAVLMIVQFQSAMKQFKDTYYDHRSWRWLTQENPRDSYDD